MASAANHSVPRKMKGALSELLHPDDVLFFAEVATVMKAVAIRYGLPLRTVTHLPPQFAGLDTDRWGDCDHEGNIRMLLREWGPEAGWGGAISPDAVWQVAAHELAHLRHMDHTPQHLELMHEMEIAITNQRGDHRDKILKKLVKMQAQRESEAKIGNLEAADAFAGMINKMLLEHELHPTEIDYARANLDDPIIELKVDLLRYHIPTKTMRSAWQESLARVVSRANLCHFLIREKSNDTWFVGTKSHATVAEYSFGVLVSAAMKLSEQEYDRYYKKLKYELNQKVPGGFKASWLNGFVQRLHIRFEEERQQAASAWAEANGGSTSTALVRLEGALIKAQTYIDDKFSGRRTAKSAPVGYGKWNPDGTAWGKAAADRINLGRKGIESSKTKLLNSGD